jgi:beta-glucosidase
VVLVVGLVCGAHLAAAQTLSAPDANALYRKQGAPIEQRVEDLLSRMTLEEKARQLDLYSGATDC